MKSEQKIGNEKYGTGILRSWASQKVKLFATPTMNGITTTTFVII